MIPALDRRGLLPAGEHCATLAELASWAAPEDARRRLLLKQFRRFLEKELRPRRWQFPLILGGSFFTSKPDPSDLDVVMICRSAPRGTVLEVERHFRLRGALIRQVYDIGYIPSLPHTVKFESILPYTRGSGWTEERGVVRLPKW